MKVYEYRYDFVENKLKERVVEYIEISGDYMCHDVLLKDKTGDNKSISFFNHVYLFHPRYKQFFSFSKLKADEKIKLINNMLKWGIR